MNNRPPYEKAEDDVILRGIAEGKSFTAIADELPRRTKWSTCQRARNYLGYTPPQNPAPPKKTKKKPRSEEGGGAMRKCLADCGEMFWSEWIGNRICKKCKLSVERAR